MTQSPPKPEAEAQSPSQLPESKSLEPTSLEPKSPESQLSKSQPPKSQLPESKSPESQPPESKGSRKTYLLIGIGVVIATAGLAAWYLLSRPKSKDLQISGRIEGYETDIGAKVPGRIAAALEFLHH